VSSSVRWVARGAPALVGNSFGAKLMGGSPGGSGRGNWRERGIVRLAVHCM
jgi:hypothetical protein